MTPEPKEVTEARAVAAEAGDTDMDNIGLLSATLAHIDVLTERLAEVERERDGAVMHSITLQEANVNLLRWQSTVPAPHLDHLLAMVRSLAASDEGPRSLRECAAASVEAELYRAFTAERINREKSERTAAEARKAAEAMEARALDAERERDEARAYMPAWSREDGGFTLRMGTLTMAWIVSEGDMFAPIVIIDRGGHRRLTKADTLEAAARSICAALRIPYVPVPDGI